MSSERSGASSILITPHVERESSESSGMKASPRSEPVEARLCFARFIACRWSFELKRNKRLVSDGSVALTSG